MGSAAAIASASAKESRLEDHQPDSLPVLFVVGPDRSGNKLDAVLHQLHVVLQMCFQVSKSNMGHGHPPILRLMQAGTRLRRLGLTEVSEVRRRASDLEFAELVRTGFDQYAGLVDDPRRDTRKGRVEIVLDRLSPDHHSLGRAGRSAGVQNERHVRRDDIGGRRLAASCSDHSHAITRVVSEPIPSIVLTNCSPGRRNR